MVAALIAAAVAAAASGCGGAPAGANNAVRSGDTSPPQVLAVPNVGLVGKTLRLTYRIVDDSGRGRIDAAIRRGSHVLAESDLGWRSNGVYDFYWRPADVGRYRFCISAIDAGGNKSRTACTPFRVFRHYPH